MESLQLSSIIRCPVCASENELVMPTDACQFLYACPHCQTVSRPLQGDCCVFCSYGSVACPPMQLERAAGGEVHQ